MLSQIEGSRAVAESVARCRVQVVPAYPISPQTHIVEGIAELVKTGALTGCEYINVESEFGAMSVAIGASAGGARTYTATSSQGLLFMCEALFNASGMGLPIVLTVANRALGAPINIWNDQSDSLSQRDSGWIQVYAEDNQHSADLHVQAFRIAEETSLPVMVCMDGFALTHAMERVDLPEQAQVDAFLPPFVPRQVIDPDNPMSIGAMVGPEAFTEVRYLVHEQHLRAFESIERARADWTAITGRNVGALVSPYRCEGADTVVVAMGSVLGTLKDTVDKLRTDGLNIGVLGITTYRPFPFDAVRAALSEATRVVVLERAFAVGVGGIVAADIRTALGAANPTFYTAVAGLGGRPVTEAALRGLLTAAVEDTLDPLTFVDLNQGVVDRELARVAGAASRTSGPTAENVLRDLRATAK